MTDAATAAPPAEEPSIEEILASIRKIISDEPAPDEAESAMAAADPDLPPPPSAELPMAEPEDILDLSAFEEPPVAPFSQPMVESSLPGGANSDFDLGLEDSHNDSSMSSEIDIDSIMAASALAPAAASPINSGDGLVSAPIADVTTAAFARLNQAADAGQTVPTQLWVGSRTIEQVVEDLMRPMLKTWLDQNLPRLVERLVEKELARMARRAVE